MRSHLGIVCLGMERRDDVAGIVLVMMMWRTIQIKSGHHDGTRTGAVSKAGEDPALSNTQRNEESREVVPLREPDDGQHKRLSLPHKAHNLIRPVVGTHRVQKSLGKDENSAP